MLYVGDEERFYKGRSDICHGLPSSFFHTEQENVLGGHGYWAMQRWAFDCVAHVQIAMSTHAQGQVGWRFQE